MTHRQPSLAAKIRAEATRSYLGPANLAEGAEANKRISSLMPHIVILFALVGAAAAFGFATKQWFTSGRVPWALLVLGIVHAVVAMAGFVMWKHVRRRLTSTMYPTSSDPQLSRPLTFAWSWKSVASSGTVFTFTSTN